MTFQEFFVDFERKNGENIFLSVVTESIEEIYKSFVDKGDVESVLEKLYYERVCSDAEYYYHLEVSNG